MLPCLVHLLFINNSICVQTGGQPCFAELFALRDQLVGHFITVLDLVNVFMFNVNGNVLLGSNSEPRGPNNFFKLESVDFKLIQIIIDGKILCDFRFQMQVRD